MILCTFSWPVQLHVTVPSGEGFFFRYEGRDVHIECQSLPGARLFSYMGEDYGWLTKEYEVESRYVRVVSDDKKVPIRQIHRKKDEVPFTGGIVDLVKYTRILVTFEVEGTEVLDNETRSGELRAWVERVVHHFIDLYRLVTQEGDVTRPRMRDAPSIDVLVADDYEFNAEVLAGKFRQYKWVHAWEDASRTGHLKETMKPEMVGTLVKLLQSGFNPRVFDKLLLDSKEQSFVRDEHDLAIVVTETAFETFLQERLLAACAARGITTLTAGRGRGATQMPYRDAIERAQVRDNLDYIQNLSGENIKGGVEHTNWYTYAYEKRNEIIHSGLRGSTFDDMGKAFTAVVTYIQLIDRTLQ
ncbi:MAG: hypothetical protein QOH63_438 [Acidobacteriota bacterium]|jgi:hypothetical protein|nr:hypothetical protein [Acidobacteriota bacterium]